MAALMLLTIGAYGVLSPRYGLQMAPQAETMPQGLVGQRLLEREITLDQRREAETLLMAFSRAQMTRHYWGEFAASLQVLGLPVGEKLKTTVERDSARTRLWIVPTNSSEAYLAQVERWNGRLRTHQCRGDRSKAGATFSGRCPEGWRDVQVDD